MIDELPLIVTHRMRLRDDPRRFCPARPTRRAQGADSADVFAELIRIGLQALIEAEATEKLGAGRDERTATRTTHRNSKPPWHSNLRVRRGSGAGCPSCATSGRRWRLCGCCRKFIGGHAASRSRSWSSSRCRCRAGRCGYRATGTAWQWRCNTPRTATSGLRLPRDRGSHWE